MQITARQPVELTAVAVSTKNKLQLPDPAGVFGFFSSGSEGAQYFDDPALGVRAFTFPALKLRITFERIRVRVEDTGSRRAEDLDIGSTLSKLSAALYPEKTFDRFGFNYDVVYRFDQMIPTESIIAGFIGSDMREEVSHFGWQFTLSKEKGKRRESYFCKVISPLEIDILANVEFDRMLPSPEETQAQFVSNFGDVQAVLKNIAFLKL